MLAERLLHHRVLGALVHRLLAVVAGQCHAVFGGERVEEALLVIIERGGVVAVEVRDAQAAVRGVGVQADRLDQAVHGEERERIR